MDQDVWMDVIRPLLDRLDRMEKRLEALEKAPKMEVHQHYHYQTPMFGQPQTYPYKFGGGGQGGTYQMPPNYN